MAFREMKMPQEAEEEVEDIVEDIVEVMKEPEEEAEVVVGIDLTIEEGVDPRIEALNGPGTIMHGMKASQQRLNQEEIV